MRLLLHKPCMFQHREPSVQRDLRTLAVNARSAKSSNNIMFFETFGLCTRCKQNRKQAEEKPQWSRKGSPKRRKTHTGINTTEESTTTPSWAQHLLQEGSGDSPRGSWDGPGSFQGLL